MIETGSYDEFIDQYSSLIESLASVGWTPAEAYARITTLYPTVSREHIARALNSGKWTFVGRKEHLVNNTMMSAALWYAVGITYDLEPDPAYTAVSLDPVIMQDIPRLFQAAEVSPETSALILARIGAGLKYLAEVPYTSLDEASYDDLLAHLPEEAQGISDEVMSWPPSRFMIEDRLGEGEWSKALLRAGVCPPNVEELGLNLAASSISDRAFRNALGEFLSYCIRYDRKPTVMLYGAWSTSTAQLGRVPLLGAVRAKYGSWSRALKLGRRMVNDALKMSAASAVPASASGEVTSPRTESLRIEDLKAQGIGVVETPKLSPEEAAEKAWKNLDSVLFSRLQELPWSQSMSVYYISPEVVATQDYTPYATILRTPAGYFCELSAAEAFEHISPDFDTDYLAQAGWVQPQNNGYPVWSQNFFSVSSAAEELLSAMRFGMGCERPDYFQSDDPGAAETSAAHPNTGSIPMVPVEQTSQVHIDWDEQ
ncbi:hypothetical protein [Rothia aerolata]|uniref:Uncharacterized protein n=1 Tax=Rothia aerolata TaxID=1812262 RepID=A0A917IUW2_9MICC|nr:hypothetical protein [Rothia aerolata]GGH62506.1 hypothetical protein GCM10007359_12790 [Rothia aerolata]